MSGRCRELDNRFECNCLTCFARVERCRTGYTLKKDRKNQNLPSGWKLATLEDVCLPVEKVKPQEMPEKSFIYLDIASIDNLRWRVVSPKAFAGKDAPSRARQKVRSGDILFSTVRTYLKNVAMVPPEYDGQVASTGFCVLYPAEEIDGKFILYYVLSDEFFSNLNPLQRGTSYPAVRDSDVLSQELRLPPLREQRRIVAEVEKQFTRLDASEAALKRVQANLKRYRASVLKAACEGKLVPTEAELAQAEGRDYEPADQLLKRILAQRRTRWESQGKKKGKYKEPVVQDTSGLPELPEGWVWATIEQIGEVGEQTVLTGPFGTNLKKEDFTSEGVPVVTIGCLTESGLNLEKAAYVSKEKAIQLNRYGLRLGDLLFSRMATVGRAGIVEKQADGCLYNYHIMRLRLDKSTLLPQFYIAYVRGSPQVDHYVTEVNHGATRDGINTTQLLEMPVSIPPLSEQVRVVDEMESRLSIIRQAEATVEASLKRIGRLRQSILKRAFCGQLVPQDPNDESASVLLKRIRAEREAARSANASRANSTRRKSRK